MNKALVLFLILAGLIATIRAADVAVTVGSDTDQLMFTPQVVTANVGDNIVFTWAGKIPHSIVQTDAAKSCVKSPTLTDISSGGAFPAPKTWTYTPKAVGKMWYMCGVAGHCAGGMYGTIIVNAAGTPPPAGGAAPPAGGAAPSGAAPGGAMPNGTMPSGGAMPANGTMPASGAAPSSTTSSANRNYYSIFTSGLVFSSMCMAAAYML